LDWRLRVSLSESKINKIMQVLFLDIDGVLNTAKYIQEHGAKDVDPHKAVILNDIVKRTGVKVVLSSTWREDPELSAIIQRVVQNQPDRCVLAIRYQNMLV